jgi:hypothetical protein
MRPQQGKQFDLKLVDDGAPVAKVRGGGGKGIIVAGLIFGVIGFAIGAGLGMSSVGRANMNTANRAAKVIKAEVDRMQKTLGQINGVVNQSRQRLQAAKKDAFSYDPQLTADLEKIPLDPRPSTDKIFRADYMRLPDITVDQLFNYYYDTLVLYGEIERHVKRTKADNESLTAFLQKEGAKQNTNYGVVFDNAGKLVVANLVEVGDPTCGKQSGKDCPADKIDGFKVRMGSGSNWSDRKLDPKSENRVVPLKPTPFMDAVMSGSPDQVRFENYKSRVATIFLTLGRLNNGSKELTKGLETAAARPDVFAPLSF